MLSPFRDRICPICHDSFLTKNFQLHILRCKLMANKELNEFQYTQFEPSNDLHDYNTYSVNEESSDHNIVSESWEISSDEEREDNDTDLAEEDIVNDEDIEELMNEFASDIDSDIPTVPTLTSYLCLFLSLWQYTFGITDTALELLLKYLSTFINIILKICPPQFSTIIGVLPSSLYTLWKYLGAKKGNFIKYVVCTKCHKLYRMDDCSETIRGIVYSKKCSNVLFPHHPQKQFRKPCNQLLLMTVSTPSGKETLYPFKIYCYQPLKQSLQKLLDINDFEDNCER